MSRKTEKDKGRAKKADKIGDLPVKARKASSVKGGKIIIGPPPRRP